ncbi:hypothetical protein P8452_00918 [Trifolium repens]|nr:hypothetical protein P8452_00918 [Trifolium repens]
MKSLSSSPVLRTFTVLSLSSTLQYHSVNQRTLSRRRISPLLPPPPPVTENRENEIQGSIFIILSGPPNSQDRPWLILKQRRDLRLIPRFPTLRTI